MRSFASAKSPISSIANVTASNDALRDEALRVFVAYSSAGVVTVNLILMPVSLKNCDTIESAPLGNAFSNCGFAKSSVCTTIASGALPAFFIARRAEIARPSSVSSVYW